MARYGIPERASRAVELRRIGTDSFLARIGASAPERDTVCSDQEPLKSDSREPVTETEGETL